jgi:hypothetical protein
MNSPDLGGESRVDEELFVASPEETGTSKSDNRLLRQSS